jgi:hypothetical protein
VLTAISASFYEQGLGRLPKDEREAARLFKLAMSFAPSDLRRWRSAYVQHARCWRSAVSCHPKTKSSGAFREPEGTDAAGERKEA